jgi:preprotein translocase subunit SecG
MGFIIVLLTVVMVLDCGLLVLLILMQLPKKEAGAGLAFGGAATDALFGAGSGNFLTKATKYTATAFFVLAVVLAVLQSKSYNRSGAEFRRSVEQGSQQTSMPSQPARPATAPATTPAEANDSGGHQSLLPAGTNTPPPK